MRKLFILFLFIALFFQSAFAINVREDSKGRPLYAADRIKVKLSEDAAERLNLVLTEKGNYSNTGLGRLDNLLESISVSKISLAHRPVLDKIWEQENGFNRWYLLFVPIGTDIESTITEVSDNEYIEFANPEYISYLSATPNDTYFDDCWGHDNTSSNGPGSGHTVGFDSHIEEAWDDSQGYGSSSIVIAILDTGVDYYHEDLDGNCVSGWDYGDGDSDPMDDSGSYAVGHGTSCAGVAAAEIGGTQGVAGVAGGCSIMPLKIADTAGDLYDSYITNAITHCGDNNVDIASMSFGSDTDQGDSPSKDAAIAYAYGQGVTLLAATANDDYSHIHNPANDEHVIAIGAASPCAERKDASSCDGENWWGSNYGVNTIDARNAVDIVAPTILPATDITGSAGFSSGDYYLSFNGTSCATPYAAGVAALLKSKDPSLTPTQIRAHLTSTATDIVDEGPLGWDRYTGYGMVNAYAAVGAVIVANAPGAPSNPTPSDSATAIDINTMISWANGVDTDDVDVYFSDNQALVTSKDPSVVISSGTLITSTDPSGVFSLSYGTDYYWRIVCNNSSRASTDGPVWSFTTVSSVVEATLSYFPDITYYLPTPDGNGISKFGVYFTPADACDLTKIKAYFNGTNGTPTSCDLKIYDAIDPGSGSEEPTNLLHTVNVPIASIAAGYSEPEYILATPIHFNAGENFFIIYEVLGTAGTDEVWLLRSGGTTGGAEGTHSICEYSGSWYYHDVLWGSPFEMAMDATVEYASTIPPNFTINPATVNFQQTAIGGWKTQVVTLQNEGGGQVVVSGVSMVGDTQIQLSDYNTYPDTLLSNESITIMVAYGPDAVVSNNATITVSETSSTRTDHLIPITGEGYIHNSWATGTPIFDQPPTGNQGDNGWSMSTSDAAPGYLHAENFWSLTDPITAVEFWGINWYHDGSAWVASDVEDPMTFEIKFYTDHATEYSPDTEVASYSLSLNRTTVDTTFSSGPVYRYWADLPSDVVLTDGWVSIQGTTVSSPDDPWFLWSESPMGDHADTAYDDVNLMWDFDEIDQAFALYTTTAPPDPPVDVTITTTPNGSDVDVLLSWTAVPGATTYTVYRVHDPNATFPAEWTAVTGVIGTSWSYTTSRAKRFYRVTSNTGTRNTLSPATDPVLKKKNTIRSITDSKLVNGSELMK